MSENYAKKAFHVYELNDAPFLTGYSTLFAIKQIMIIVQHMIAVIWTDVAMDTSLNKPEKTLP